MSYELREGSGSLFKNDKKEKESHPAYRGDIMIEGKAYWLSAWVKEGKNGKFFSLSAKKKDGEKSSPAPAAPIADDNLEDLPF